MWTSADRLHGFDFKVGRGLVPRRCSCMGGSLHPTAGHKDPPYNESRKDQTAGVVCGALLGIYGKDHHRNDVAGTGFESDLLRFEKPRRYAPLDHSLNDSEMMSFPFGAVSFRPVPPSGAESWHLCGT